MLKRAISTMESTKTMPGDRKTQPSSSLACLVHQYFPPPRIQITPYWPNATSKKPRGIRRVLYKFFPPPLQTDVPWYSSSIAHKLKVGTTQEMYSAYTGLKGPNLEKHIEAIRNRVWAIAPYPCFGRGWFLQPALFGQDMWSEAVNAGKEGKSILDLGCGLGQDLRQLRIESGGRRNYMRLMQTRKYGILV